jgi:hypothetical protein
LGDKGRRDISLGNKPGLLTKKKKSNVERRERINMFIEE